jgi:hypothetical protein
MINWGFMWSSRRAPAWENCNDAMNLALGDNWVFGDYYFPVNSGNTGSPLVEFNDDQRIQKMTAPVIDQFESEAFKYVIDENRSGYNFDAQERMGQLILKEHLALDISLTPENSRVINLDEVYRYLQDHDWVALGTPLNNIEISKKTLMAKAFYYTRDKDLKIVNLSGENQPHNDVPSIPTVTYCVFKKTKNGSYINCIVNPHLVAVPQMDVKTYGEHRVFALDSFDSTIEDYFLRPSIIGSDTKIINNNVIFTTVQFTMHEYESGFHFIRHKTPIVFPRKITTNLEISAVGNVIKITPSRNYGYISIEYDVDAMINSYGAVSRIGKHKIEYTVIRG